MPIFRYRSRIEAPPEDVFAWHERPGALERLTPPWESVEVIERTGGLEDRARVVLRIHTGPISLRWVAEHRDYIPGQQFRDVQLEGPFARWVHTHRFERADPNACNLEDRIEYELPYGPVADVIAGDIVRAKLDRMFRHRHRITAQDMALHAKRKGGGPMNILITGSSGLVGSSLVPFLTTGGHMVTRLFRSKAKFGREGVYWDPKQGVIDLSGGKDLDAVVHLAGETLADENWTEEKKTRIRESRVNGTKLLSDALAGLSRPPRVLVCASAIGYYGDRKDEILTEESAMGSGFLAEVCEEWEQATSAARSRGIRVVNLRIGIVLTPKGGALSRMLMPFRLGVGGNMGDGRQYWSWIHIDDVIGALYHALTNESLDGPVNAVAPKPVTNREFTGTLGRVLGRPTLLAVPGCVARLAFGEMADALLLASSRVEPRRLLASGYEFRYSDLEAALRHLTGK